MKRKSSRIVCTSLPKDTVDLIEKLAKRLRVSRSQVVRMLILEALGARWEEEKPPFNEV